MKFGNIEIPANLIQSLQENRVIVFAGAGVSMGEPANLPDFFTLTRKILNLDDSDYFDSPDQKLGEGFDQGVKIHEQCIRILRQGLPQPTKLHHDILNIFPKMPKVITTNFDLLFEKAFENMYPNSYISTFTAPVFPLGNNIEGIIYLHGNINDPRSMVLSDADFGRAYLSESWAKRLLSDAFLNYDFIFIGYSYNDTILKYLTRSLPRNRISKLYAFANIEDGNVQQINHWRSLGIEPLIYKKENGTHQQLPQAVEKLADFLNLSLSAYDNFIKLQVTEYEINQQEDILNYIKFFLVSDDGYKQFYSVAQPNVWLKKIKEDQVLFDAFMKHESDFFQWLIGYLETHLNEMIDLLQTYPLLKSSQDFLWRVFRKLDDTSDKIIYWKWFLFLEKDLYLGKGLYNNVHSWVLKKLINFELINEFSRALAFYLNIDIKPKIKFSTNEYEFYLLLEKIKNNEIFHQISLQIFIIKLEEYDAILELYDQKKQSTAWFKKEIWERDKSYSKDLNFDLIHGIVEILSTKKLIQGDIDDYAKQFLEKRSILLKRLGVYLLAQFSSYNADFIYSLISFKIDFFNLEYRSEIFKFLEKNYQKLTDIKRNEIISKIKSNFDRDYEKLKWFAWIYKFSPMCTLIEQEYKNLKLKFPNFNLNEKPYLAWSSSGIQSVVYTSPFLVDDIQARNDYIWYLALLEYDLYKPSFNNMSELSYEGLWQEIQKTNVSWLLDFLEFTIQIMPEHKIIQKIIGGIKNWKFNQEIHEKIYDIFNKILTLKDQDLIFDTVQFLSDLNDVEYYKCNLQSHAVWIECAKKIIKLHLYLESPMSDEVGGFIKSLNSINGRLAWFILKLYDQAKDNTEIKTTCEEFIKILISQDQYGDVIIILLNNYYFFKNKNSLFAQKDLFPYLFSSNEIFKIKAWQGFLKNPHLEYAEFREIHKEFFNILKYALNKNDKLLIQDLTALYVYSIYFDYHQNAIKSFRDLQRLESNIIAEKILDTVRKILAQEKDIDKVWSWLGEYLQDRVYQINQVLSYQEVSKIWYLLTDHPQLIVKLEQMVLNLPFKEDWIGFLHDISRNHLNSISGYETVWCNVLAFYLNQQDERILSLCNQQEHQLFGKLIDHDQTGVLKKALSKKGIQI